MTWRERIVAARGRGRFTADDRDKVDKWETCAVGEQHAAHPLVVHVCNKERGGYSPNDPVLRNLGGVGGFCGAVLLDRVDRADVLLDQIEDRVLELKRGGQA